MSLPGAKTAKNFSRWLRARVLGGALILGYHRIHAVEDDFYQVCVSPENFAGQMEALRELAHPVRLSELVQNLKQNKVPPKAVAVTFDDGYADNLYAAKPILEKYEIPATVFMCTGYMGKEFWWDELGRLVMSSRAELGALCLDVEERQFAWDRPEVSPEPNLRTRREFCHALYNFLLALDVEGQNQAMKTIRHWAGISPDGTGARALSHDELLQLAKGGLIEIGAHTSHHPMLPQLPVERQKEEIQSSKQDLETLLGKRIEGFSYPNGRATMDAKRLVRELAFTYACTSLQDVIRPRSDLYELTRFWQQDADVERFVKRLNTWMSMKIH